MDAGDFMAAKIAFYPLNKIKLGRYICNFSSLWPIHELNMKSVNFNTHIF